jgi:hypothetical protein
LVAALALAAAARAEGEAVEPEVALPILLRVLTYDRGFKARGEGDFLVLLPADAANISRRDKVLAVARGMKLTSIQNRPLRYQALDFTSADALGQAIGGQTASAVLLIPGLPTAAVEQAKRAANGIHAYVLSLDTAVVEQKNAMVGVSIHDGHPQIVLNVDGARAANANFDNAVLKVARLVE